MSSRCGASAQVILADAAAGVSPSPHSPPACDQNRTQRPTSQRRIHINMQAAPFQVRCSYRSRWACTPAKRWRALWARQVLGLLIRKRRPATESQLHVSEASARAHRRYRSCARLQMPSDICTSGRQSFVGSAPCLGKQRSASKSRSSGDGCSLTKRWAAALRCHRRNAP